MSSNTDWYRAPPMILPKEPSQIYTEGKQQNPTLSRWLDGKWSSEELDWSYRHVPLFIFLWMVFFLLFFFTSCWILVKTSMTDLRHLSLSHMWQAEWKCGPQDSHPSALHNSCNSLPLNVEGNLNIMTYSSSVFVTTGHMWLLNIEAWLMQLNNWMFYLFVFK